MITMEKNSRSTLNDLIDLPALLQRSAAQHSHLCPRQVLGVRMGLAGLAALGMAAPLQNKAALVFIESDGCFATGIEVSTGAAVGHRTLRVMDLGKVAATFAEVSTGRAIRLAARPDLRAQAAIHAPDAMGKYAAQLAAYQSMADDALFSLEDVTLDPPLAAVLSQPGLRTCCVRCGEEIINAREVVRAGECLCRACAGEGYYSRE
jgi:formylmethanofuran dehydrogenase subunit E